MQNERHNVSVRLGGEGARSIGRHLFLGPLEQGTQSGSTPEKREALTDQARRGVVATQVWRVTP